MAGVDTMAETFSRWDVVEHLKTDEEIARYLDACEAEGDPALLLAAMGDIARARNMMQLAKDTGISRAGLYKAFSGDSNPSFATVVKVAHALGLRLRFEPKQS
jgi:probable addiction module antidote protein